MRMIRNRGHIPIRTCISCGKKRSKQDLIRLVLDANGQIVRDDSGRGKGRGAYICASENCIERSGKDGRLKRAFRREVAIDFDLRLDTHHHPLSNGDRAVEG